MVRFDPFEEVDLTRLTPDHFARLVRNKVLEGLWVEYKSQWTAEKVARAVASFANSEGGGTVVVGVSAEGLEPVDAGGFEFPGEIEAAVVNALRSHVDPIPRCEVGSTTSSDGNVLLAIRVPPGSDPPYMMKNGAVLVRTPTSSEPIRLNDRESMDRLYRRGRGGEEWALAQREARLQSVHAMATFPRWIKFWSFPCVDGGWTSKTRSSVRASPTP